MRKGNSSQNKWIIFMYVLRIVFCLTLIFSAYNIVKWYINNKENNDIKKELLNAVVIYNNETQYNNEEHKNTNQELKVDFSKLKKINSEVVAWIKLRGTDIDYAVVQTSNNKYYLSHNIAKSNNSAGWIFADYKNTLDGTDKNIVIYGHNMLDNSMFGTLRDVLNKEWYENKENHVVEFVTEHENAKYQVFSVYQTQNEDYYIQTDFNNIEFKKFIQTIKARSIVAFDIDITEEDNILTLSTCANNNLDRIVLHAKKIIN